MSPTSSISGPSVVSGSCRSPSGVAVEGFVAPAEPGFPSPDVEQELRNGAGGRAQRAGQPQCALPVRIGSQVQALPRPAGVALPRHCDYASPMTSQLEGGGSSNPWGDISDYTPPPSHLPPDEDSSWSLGSAVQELSPSYWRPQKLEEGEKQDCWDDWLTLRVASRATNPPGAAQRCLVGSRNPWDGLLLCKLRPVLSATWRQTL